MSESLRPSDLCADRHHRAPLAYVLCAAVVVKIVYLACYVELPFLYGPMFDAQVYLLQARRVAQGAFGDPALLAFSPLYGYLLALLGARAGSILPVVLQLALGLANVALLHRITARAFGSVAAVVAAIAYAGYGPLLQLETKLMSETLGLALLLAALERMTAGAFVAGRAAPALLAGALAALAVLARASLLMTLPLLAIAAAVDLRAGVRWAGQRALAFASTALLVLGSYGAWTERHSGVFVPVVLTSNTVARASQVSWEGDLSVFRGEGEQGVSAFSVVSQARARLTRLRLRVPEPADPPFSLRGYLRQVPRKLLHTLADRETTFDYGFYGERSELRVLRVPFVSFGMLLAFAGVGVVALLRGQSSRSRVLLPVLAAVALGTALTTTLVHPSTRYRLPLVLVMAPLAGHAWATLLAAPRSVWRTRALAGSALLLVALAALHQSRALVHPGLWELRVAEAAALEGDVREARARIREALAQEGHAPAVQARADYVRTMLPPEPASGAAD